MTRWCRVSPLCTLVPLSVVVTSSSARRCGVPRAQGGMGRSTGSDAMAVAWRTAGASSRGRETTRTRRLACLCYSPPLCVFATSLRARRCCVPRARGRMRWSEDHGGRVEQGRSGQQGTSDGASAPALRFRPACVPRVSELVHVEFQGRGNDWEQAAEAEYADASLAPAGDHPPIGASEVNKGPTALCQRQKMQPSRQEAAVSSSRGGTVRSHGWNDRESNRRPQG